MADRPYTKRELDLLFRSAEEKNDAWSGTILQKLDDIEKDKIDPMLAQTKLTNGRVNRLENSRAYLLGFCACITVLILPTLFFVASIIIK